MYIYNQKNKALLLVYNYCKHIFQHNFFTLMITLLNNGYSINLICHTSYIFLIRIYIIEELFSRALTIITLTVQLKSTLSTLNNSTFLLIIGTIIHIYTHLCSSLNNYFFIKLFKSF